MRNRKVLLGAVTVIPYRWASVAQQHHNLYQEAANDLEFTELNQQNWKAVDAQDTYVE